MRSIHIVDCGQHTTKYAALSRKSTQGAVTAVQELEHDPQSEPLCEKTEHHWAAALAEVYAANPPSVDDATMVFLLDPLTHKETKQRLLHLAFEQLGLRKVCLGYAPSCALFACGETSGVVVDLGYSGVRIAPICKGVPYTELCVRYPSLGTHAVDTELCAAWDDGVRPSRDVLLAAKQQLCLLGEEVKGTDSECVLPDGTTMHVPLTPQQCRSASMRLLYSSTANAPAALCYTTRKVAARNAEASAQWLCIGGGAAISGASGVLAECLARDVLMSPPRQLHARSATHVAVDGGIILSQLGSFKDMCVQLSDYIEDGPQRCIHMKIVDDR